MKKKKKYVTPLLDFEEVENDSLCGVISAGAGNQKGEGSWGTPKGLKSMVFYVVEDDIDEDEEEEEYNDFTRPWI